MSVEWGLVNLSAHKASWEFKYMNSTELFAIQTVTDPNRMFGLRLRFTSKSWQLSSDCLKKKLKVKIQEWKEKTISRCTNSRPIVQMSNHTYSFVCLSAVRRRSPNTDADISASDSWQLYRNNIETRRTGLCNHILQILIHILLFKIKWFFIKRISKQIKGTTGNTVALMSHPASPTSLYVEVQWWLELKQKCDELVEVKQPSVTCSSPLRPTAKETSFLNERRSDFSLQLVPGV